MLNYLSELAPYYQNITLVDVAVTYAALSAATGLCSYITVYRPILKSLEVYEEENEEYLEIFELAYPYQTMAILVVLNTLLAPLIFKTCLTGPNKEFVSAYIDKILPDYDEDDE